MFGAQPARMYCWDCDDPFLSGKNSQSHQICYAVLTLLIIFFWQNCISISYSIIPFFFFTSFQIVSSCFFRSFVLFRSALLFVYIWYRMFINHTVNSTIPSNHFQYMHCIHIISLWWKQCVRFQSQHYMFYFNLFSHLTYFKTTEDASIELHRARTIIGADGDEVMMVRAVNLYSFASIPMVDHHFQMELIIIN